MQIWVDAPSLGNQPFTGIENYTLNLINNLSALDLKNSYKIFGLRINQDGLDISTGKFVLKKIPDLIRARSIWYSWSIWNYFISPILLLKERPDLYISSIPALPLYCAVPSIFIAYDVCPLIITNAFFTRTRVKFKMDIQHAARCANSIIAISQSTKDDMVKYLKVDQSKISIIYPGYDNSIFLPVNNQELLDGVCRKYGIHGNYIFHVGTLEPRKNTKRLIEAYLKLRLAGNIKHKLVITGAKGWLYDDVQQLIQEAVSRNEIILTGYVDIIDLPALYSGADAFIYPSLYEGFGLPPLEAMACGTPVITSNISSLPEVVGDAGMLVDPYNVDEIAQAIYRVISDNKLCEDMKRKGLKRAQVFSWGKSARKMLNVIESTVRRH